LSVAYAYEEGCRSMNLAEFVEESLTEILAGIRSAQKKEGGDATSSGGKSVQ
jgi:hypothetical protein